MEDAGAGAGLLEWLCVRGSTAGGRRSCWKLGPAAAEPVASLLPPFLPPFAACTRRIRSASIASSSLPLPCCSMPLPLLLLPLLLLLPPPASTLSSASLYPPLAPALPPSACPSASPPPAPYWCAFSGCCCCCWSGTGRSAAATTRPPSSRHRHTFKPSLHPNALNSEATPPSLQMRERCLLPSYDTSLGSNTFAAAPAAAPAPSSAPALAPAAACTCTLTCLYCFGASLSYSSGHSCRTAL